jgi:hypothetical protein
MVVQKGLILERHNQLINYNGYVSQPKPQAVVFEAFITSDEKYFVMNDHVIDLHEKTNLGYIWESMDVFRTIFTNVKDDSKEFRELRESILSSPLLENNNQNLYELRDFFLQEGFLDDTWLGRKVKSAGEGVADFTSQAINKMEEFGVSISNSQFAEVMKAIGRGALWVLRKFKEAAYSTVGIIVDAILIATGIGKVAQVVFWALVTGLDVYQISTGDWEPAGTETWVQWMDLTCDLIGLIGAGVAAKGARGLVKSIKSATELPKFIKGNKALMNIIGTIKGGVSSLVSKLTGMLKGLKGKWKPLDAFIDKIISMASSVMNNMRKFFNFLFPGSLTTGLTKTQKLQRGVTSGAVAGGLVYGIEKVTGSDNITPSQSTFSDFDISSADIDPEEF